MTQEQLNIWNVASKAAVAGQRVWIARALRLARKHGREFQSRVVYQVSFIGWPVRKRPNGRYS